MARLPRLVIGGLPHLVQQRAHHGQAMVRDDQDRALLVQLLRDAAQQHGVAVHAYGLADDRFDAVATPADGEALGRWMQAVGRRYAAAFNRRHGRSGGLWGSRFRAAVIEPDAWLLHCMVHAEQAGASPLRADGGTWPWSSRGHHSGAQRASWLQDPPAYWALGNTPFEREAQYRARADNALTPTQTARIEGALKGGWVLGSEVFAATLPVTAAVRPHAPRRRGRPRKTVQEESVPN